MTRAREVCGAGALAVLMTAALGVTGAAAQQASPAQSQQQAHSSPSSSQKREKPPQKPAQKPEEQKPAEQQLPTYAETVVVTASKVETQLVNAPATMSVIGSQTIQASASQSYADLMRAVPGMNVAQTSARDINITSRGATSTLSTSQLALLDGRSLYLDFFGFVAWDFLPVNMDEIKQIEVIRGPASAVWGANALTGVVNIITKSPREMQGDEFTLGAGAFDRNVGNNGLGQGSLFYVNGTHAAAPNDRWSYKISAGAFTQDAFARPTGTIPNQFHTAYPAFPNSGTTQPKFDTRVDYDMENGGKVVVAGGVAGTSGIIDTGIGPFQIKSGSVLGYTKVNYSKGALRVNGYVNLLDGKAPALLSVDATTGQPVNFTFNTKTFDLEFGNSNAIGTTQVVSYGGNFRHNSFALSIAPNGDNRTEGGAYVQDEIFLSDHFRWLVGARVDKFSVLKNAVFSPRTTFMIKPAPDQTFRISYNRAYRAPSLVNNFLQLTIVNQLDLGAINQLLAGRLYNFPVVATGNENLKETSLDAYEVGYTGTIRDRATVTAAFYVNDTKNDIFFTQVGSYNSHNRAAALAAAAAGARPADRAERVRAGPRAAVGVQLRELRQGPRQGPGAGPRPGGQPGRARLHQLLVPGHAGPDRLRHLGDQHPGEEPLQRRRELQRGPVPGRPLDELQRRGGLERRARRPLPRADQGLHDGERRLRRPLGAGQGDDVAEDHQPRQHRHPAARLRRHHEAPDRRRAEGEVLGGHADGARYRAPFARATRSMASRSASPSSTGYSSARSSRRTPAGRRASSRRHALAQLADRPARPEPPAVAHHGLEQRLGAGRRGLALEIEHVTRGAARPSPRARPACGLDRFPCPGSTSSPPPPGRRARSRPACRRRRATARRTTR